MRDGQVEHQGLMVLSVGDCLEAPDEPERLEGEAHDQ